MLFLPIQWIIAHSNLYLLTMVHNKIINFDDEATVGNPSNDKIEGNLFYPRNLTKNGQYLVKVSHLTGWSRVHNVVSPNETRYAACIWEDQWIITSMLNVGTLSPAYGKVGMSDIISRAILNILKLLFNSADSGDYIEVTQLVRKIINHEKLS